MSLPDPPPGTAGTVASSEMMLSWPVSWDGCTNWSVNTASNRSRLMAICRLAWLTVTRGSRSATFCAMGAAECVHHRQLLCAATHASRAGEVERNQSNLVADFRAHRASLDPS